MALACDAPSARPSNSPISTPPAWWCMSRTAKAARTATSCSVRICWRSCGSTTVVCAVNRRWGCFPAARITPPTPRSPTTASGTPAAGRAFGFSNEAQDVLERLTHKTGGHVEYPLNSLYKDVSGYLSNPSDDGNYALTVGTGGY